MFNEKDLHSGFAPFSIDLGSTFDDDDLKGVGQAWDLADKVVCYGLVYYTSDVTTEHSSSYAVTPSTGFGNFGTQNSSELRSHNFAQDGQFKLRSPLDASSHLAHEMTFKFLNGLAVCGLKFDQPNTLNWLLSQVRYRSNDAEGEWAPVRL